MHILQPTDLETPYGNVTVIFPLFSTPFPSDLSDLFCVGTDVALSVPQPMLWSRNSAQARRLRKFIAAPDIFMRYVLSKLPYLFSFKMATLYKNVFSNQIFCYRISSSLINRKEPEPEPQFVISAPAGNLISAPCSTGSGSRTLPLTDQMYQRVCCSCEEQTYR